jgi:hypothetical protein
MSVALVAATATDDVVARTLPHESQNFAPTRFGAPHDPQLDGNCTPHASQNFAASRFSAPQLEQRILPLWGDDFAR